MKLISTIGTVLLCFSFVLLPNVSIAEEPHYTSPVLIGTDNPLVDKSFKSEREYWTFFNFIVDKSGNVISPLVLDHNDDDDTVTDRIQWIKGLNYKPAMMNGKPVASGQLYLLKSTVSAGYDQNKSAGKRFAERYGEAVGLVAKNQLEEAEKAIQALKQDFTSNLVRQAWIAWVSSMFDFRRQDYNGYLRNLTIAGSLAEKYLSSSVTAKLYMNLFEMQMYAHHYLDAFDTVVKMQLSNKVNIDRELLNSLLERATLELASDSAFSVEMTLPDQKWQHYRTHRSELRLDWESGTLTGLQLRCPNRIENYIQQLDEQQQSMTINELSEHCVLLVQGKQGSQVTVNVGQELATNEQ